MISRGLNYFLWCGLEINVIITVEDVDEDARRCWLNEGSGLDAATFGISSFKVAKRHLMEIIVS